MADTISSKRLSELGTFEISKYLLKMANNSLKETAILNAGQGDPNWINTKARLAFTSLVKFGVNESHRTISEGSLAGFIEKAGISERFKKFLLENENIENSFLIEALNYVKSYLSMNEDDVVAEWINGVIGNNYPTPSRVLIHTEKILSTYLESVLFPNTNLSTTTEVFPTEGGTAAIVYIFNTLRENKLISIGDKIAINTPIFPPYLEIPFLNDYEMIEVDFQSTEENKWQIDPKEIEKLSDTDVKAIFLVNPSNPGAKAFDKEGLKALEKLVEKKPDLMIITDDVYGTFVDSFESVYSVLPYNTLLVYSFSKLFGAAGWRLGTIAANQKNIFDEKISQLAPAIKVQVTQRYTSDSSHPEKMKFIDRLVADSRSVGLYHTAGLSTPQQMMEVLFSLTHLINKNKRDNYFIEAKKIISSRYSNLHGSLSMNQDNSPFNSKYYSLINIFEVAEHAYDIKFRNYLEDHYETIDFLVDLAKKKGIVLAYGPGFHAPRGYLRVSEANLPTEDYQKVGQKILSLLEDYHEVFLSKNSLTD